MYNKKSPSPRIARKREARIKHILDTALGCMTETGVEGLSMHEVAARLDLTVGALYRYFASKGELIAALEARVIDDYAQNLGKLVLTPKPMTAEFDERVDSLVQILEMVLAFRYLSSQKPVHMQLINGILASPSHLLPPMQAQRIMGALVTAFAPFESLFERAKKNRALDPGDASARLIIFWNAARGILQLSKLSAYNPERFENQRLFQETMNALLRGWGASTEDLERAWLTARHFEGDIP